MRVEQNLIICLRGGHEISKVKTHLPPYRLLAQLLKWRHGRLCLSCVCKIGNFFVQNVSFLLSSARATHVQDYLDDGYSKTLFGCLYSLEQRMRHVSLLITLNSVNNVVNMKNFTTTAASSLSLLQLATAARRSFSRSTSNCISSSANYPQPTNPRLCRTARPKNFKSDSVCSAYEQSGLT